MIIVNKTYNFYLLHLFHSIPSFVYWILLSLLFVVCLLLSVAKGVRSKGRIALLFIGTEYYFLVLCSTVFFREAKVGRSINVSLCEKYNLIDIARYAMPELIMNTVIFIPIGVISYYYKKKANLLVSILVGLSLSLIIEILQFVFSCGASELIDVVHNTFGCVVGYLLGIGSTFIISMFNSKSMEVEYKD